MGTDCCILGKQRGDNAHIEIKNEITEPSKVSSFL